MPANRPFGTTTYHERRAIEDRAWLAAIAEDASGRSYGLKLDEELRKLDPAERTRFKAVTLATRALQGEYAVFLQVSAATNPKRPLGSFTRLGKARLERLFPEQVRANLAVNVGGPCYVIVTSRNGIPCLQLRARFGGDFRELGKLVVSTIKAYDHRADVTVLYATKPAAQLIERGL